MNEKLTTLQKKIQSTHEELDRVKTNINKDSPEGLLALQILEMRLSFLLEQVSKMTNNDSSTINSNNMINTELLPYVAQIALTQKTLTGLFSLRAVSHFLFGFQHLLDMITKKPGELPNDSHVNLWIKIIQGSPLTLELRANNPKSKTQYKNTLQIISKLLTISDTKDPSNKPPGASTGIPIGMSIGTIPEWLVELEPRVFSYAKKWMIFLIENEIEFHSDFTRLHANTESLQRSLTELNHIRKEMSEPIPITGIVNAINLSDRYIELLDTETLKRNRIRSNYTFLIDHRQFLGEVLTLKVSKLVTENTQSGNIETLLFVFH